MCNKCKSELKYNPSIGVQECSCKTCGLNSYNGRTTVVCSPFNHDFAVRLPQVPLRLTFINGSYVSNYSIVDLFRLLEEWVRDKPISHLELFGEYYLSDIEPMNPVRLIVEPSVTDFDFLAELKELQSVLECPVIFYNKGDVSFLPELVALYKQGSVVINSKE